MSSGSGTTPTVMGKQWVAITDNADPMQVVVYRRARRVRRQPRGLLGPGLLQGASATENSLVGAGRTIIVTNNYGYTGPDRDRRPAASRRPASSGSTSTATAGGATGCGRTTSTAPRRRCRSSRSATDSSTRSPRTPSRQDPLGIEDAWYLSAFDARTGQLVYRSATAPASASTSTTPRSRSAPTGTAYVGVLGGLVRIADTR